MEKQTLFALTAQMQEIEGILEESGGELTTELETAWEETRESLMQKVDSYNALVQKLSAYTDNIKAEVKRLQALSKTADNSLKRVKEHIAETMIANNITSLEGQYCKMTLAKSTATVVDDETVLKPYEPFIESLRQKLPAYVTVDLSISKTAIKETTKELPAGVTLPGVTFVQNTSLRIK